MHDLTEYSIQQEAFSSVSLFLYPELLKKALMLIHGSNSTQFAPICVEVRPTNQCNKNCSWCFTKINRDSSRLDEDFFFEVIDTLYGFGTQCFHLSGGGEPSVYEGLYQLEALKNKNPKIIFGMISNGVNYSDDIVELVINTIDWIRFSLTSETQNGCNNNGLDNQFSTIKKVKLAQNGKFINVGASYVFEILNEQTLSEIDNIGRICNELELAYLQIKQPFLSTNDPINSFLNTFLQNLSHRPPIHRFHPLESPNWFSHCYYGLLSTVIGADGNIYPCCFSQEVKRNFGSATSYMNKKMIDSKYWGKLKAIDVSSCKYCRHVHFNKIIEFLVNQDESKAFEIIDSITDGCIVSEKENLLAFKHIPEIPNRFIEGLYELNNLKNDAIVNKSLLFPVYRDYDYIGSK